MDFFHSTPREAGVIKWVQFLQCPPPKICDGKKSSKIFRDFWQLSTLIANVSGTDSQIENRKSSSSTTTPPTLGEKSWWTSVHKQKSYCRAYWPNQVDIVREQDYISALTGWCALKFLYALQIAEELLTHTQTGTGSPFPKNNDENSKFGLNLACAPLYLRG